MISISSEVIGGAMISGAGDRGSPGHQREAPGFFRPIILICFGYKRFFAG
jgi:hypothetical protein